MNKLEKIEDFDSIINNGKVVVDFYAEWCGPCKMLEPILIEVSKSYNDICFLSVNVDNYRELAKRYGVMSLPCLKLFDNGKEIKSSIGFMNYKELEEFIK